MKDAQGTFYLEDRDHLGARFNIEGRDLAFHAATGEPLEPFPPKNAKIYYGSLKDLDGKHAYRARLVRDGFALELDNGVVLAGDFDDFKPTHDFEIGGSGEWGGQ